jgi:hypothetical protein
MVVTLPSFPLNGGIGGVGGEKVMVVVKQFPVLNAQCPGAPASAPDP